MTEVVVSNYDLDGYVRDRVDSVIVSSGGNSSRTLHIEGADGKPVCSARLRTAKRWMDKSLAVYPPGFHPMCEHCAEQRFDIEVMDYE